MNSLLCKSESPSKSEGKIFPSLTDKEFLYVGHYIDINGNYILKVGTTNDLKRRRTEHTRNYKKSPNYTMPPNGTFEYDFWLPLSKYNTLRYEDRNRALWIEQNIGEFVRNDRFFCPIKPNFVEIHIRKTYIVQLVQKKPPKWWLFCAFRRPFSHARAGFSAFCTVLEDFFAKLCAKLPLDKFPKMWYNSIVQGARLVHQGSTDK